MSPERIPDYNPSKVQNIKVSIPNFFIDKYQPLPKKLKKTPIETWHEFIKFGLMVHAINFLPDQDLFLVNEDSRLRLHLFGFRSPETHLHLSLNSRKTINRVISLQIGSLVIRDTQEIANYYHKKVEEIFSEFFILGTEVFTEIIDHGAQLIHHDRGFDHPISFSDF